ncbi:MAG: hypothetical protein LBU92_00390 [Prevotellaceae bacterium]|jgi:hypothetical protein|nr:hypothetical protein [Prevotellaceae bacterium]
MDTFTQLLIASLASGLMLFGAVYLVLRRMLAAESERRNIALIKSTKDITLPLRLQAHERLLMLMERISPEALVLRLRRPDASNAELHAELIAAIRAEFEHNLSQQMYVSTELWSAIVLAKNGVITACNTCAQQVQPQAPSIQLAQKLLEYHVANELPTSNAILQVKKEVARLF